MTTLSRQIGQLKATADRLGHRHISARCDQASQQVGFASNSWGGISSLFGSSPWRARRSYHGNRVQSSMSSCGNHLDWIYKQPEIYRFPDYNAPVGGCKRSYNSCQSGCRQVWNWPTPPGYGPQPSQYAGLKRHLQTAPKQLCPNHQTACPITINGSGHECIDTQTEITSCGGCESLNEGENCLAIEGADEVGCELGRCRVFSAMPGYAMSESHGRPVPKPSKA